MNNIVLNINKIDQIDEVLEVGEEVFKPNKEEKEKYHKKEVWLNKIENGLLISASVDNKIVGFAICYKKETDLHIWNVGVLEEYRKFGIWKKMYNEVVKFAIENEYESISLNTYKEKFLGMYTFCIKEGFVEYKIEFDEFQNTTKSMFRKKI
ncbi:MAG: GNAT family N-acetyltransferase [Candidatus Shapirobacteria bacterium]